MIVILYNICILISSYETSFMLEKLFGSKTRVLLLKLFLNNPNQPYFVRELARNLDSHLNAIRRELENLQDLQIINCFDKAEKVEGQANDNRKYYQLNPDFPFIEELRSVLVKSHLLMERALIGKVEKLGNIDLFLLSGLFVGRDDAPADMLIVGGANRAKLARLVAAFEREVGRTINYTVLSKSDYAYRRALADRFLFDLLENKNIILIDHFHKGE